MATPEEIDAGQAAYSPMVLRLYNAYVLGLSNHLVWRCPTAALRSLYDRNVRARHIDIGVGTGYFLDHAKWPVPRPDITLVDLNPNCLEAAANSIKRYAPESVRASILDPLPAMGTFQSAGLCYLLHCLPGSIPEKAVAFDNLRPLLAPDARIFGATILQEGVQPGRIANALMAAYNSKGIFSNAADRLADLETALKTRFFEVRIEVKGVVALFEARAAAA